MSQPVGTVGSMVLRAVVATVFPTLCPGCGARGDPVCAACAATLRRASPAPPPRGVDLWVAPYAYEGVARELVARVKYRQARAALPWLAAAVAESVAAVRPSTPLDAVTWVPTTSARRRSRGFDHAELLARSVAHVLGLRAVAMLRREPGPPQTGLPSAARRVGPGFRPRTVVPARVLVVDDVATTGGTLAAAASALRAGGAAYVVAAVAARTPRAVTGSRIARDLHHAE